MSDNSHITVGPGGTMYAGHDAVKLFQAASVRGMLKLLQAGITPTRGATKKKVLAVASTFTGVQYKHTEIAKAVSDLTVWVETMKSALPIEHKE